MLVHPRVTPSIKFAGTHLYIWVERGTVRVKCLAQEHNTMSPARARTRTNRSGDERINHEATAPPKGRGKGVLLNSAKGQNSSNHRAGGPAITSCLRRLMASIKLYNTPFLFTFKIHVCRLCFLNRNAPLIVLGYKKSKRSLEGIRF